MRVIAALLDHRAGLAALKRSLPRGAPPVVGCRSPRGLQQTLAGRLIEAVVLGAETARRLPVSALRSSYPSIPVVIYGVIRPDDAELLLSWQRLDLAGVAVDGVDDAGVGDLVMRQCHSARRRAALAEAPRLLRLTEPLQQRTWEALVAASGTLPRIGALAQRLGISREHLSRQFGAGGAPNLKRVADLLTVHAALGLLGNPGYSPAAVARLLGLASPNQLRLMVKRITGVAVEEARQLGEREVFARFVRLSARSRR